MSISINVCKFILSNLYPKEENFILKEGKYLVYLDLLLYLFLFILNLKEEELFSKNFSINLCKFILSILYPKEEKSYPQEREMIGFFLFATTFVPI